METTEKKSGAKTPEPAKIEVVEEKITTVPSEAIEDVPGQIKIQELSDNTINISKGDLTLILDRLEKLEARNTIKKAKVQSSDTVTVAFYDNKPVVGFGKFSKTYDNMGEEQLWLEVRLMHIEGHIITKTLLYSDFLKACVQRTATVINRDVEDKVDEIMDTRTGQTMEIERRETQGYTMKGLGFTVPVVVTTKKVKFNVIFDDGLKLSVDEDVVNI